MGHRMTRPRARFLGALALVVAVLASAQARAQGYSPTGTCSAHQWNYAYGSMTTAADCLQPGFADISGTVGSSQLPLATTGAVGGVKIGAGLGVSSGTVSAAPPQSGYFSYSSATLVEFCPENGAVAQVAGALLTIQSSCVTAANTSVQVFSTGSSSSAASLANSTLYYVGVLNNSGALAIAFFPASAYGHAPDTTSGNLGVEVITSSGSPLTSYTLVGMAYTSASGQFQAQGTGTLSWFNRVLLKASPATLGNVSTSAGSTVSLSSSVVAAMKWAADDLQGILVGSVLENNASGTGTVGFGQNGACSSLVNPSASIAGNGSSIYAPLSLLFFANLASAEGYETLAACGNSGSSSYTLTVNGLGMYVQTRG